MAKLQPQWIGVDWGTTNLRVLAVDGKGRILAEQVSDRGMAKLQPHEFEAALLALIEPWLDVAQIVPVYVCGMAGARQGWVEARYRSVPCRPVAHDGLTVVKTADPRINVRILPGLSQVDPPDVMRGEETQIAGFLASNPAFAGVICLPGTHSKWVAIQKGEIAGFSTFMTGELFAILSSHSVLRHSVNSESFDRPNFLEAARRASQNPETSVEMLFGLRAASLLSNLQPEQARARLSGMLIGQEIGLARRYWHRKEVALIGAGAVASLYADVLKDCGVPVAVHDVQSATLAGLAIAASAE